MPLMWFRSSAPPHSGVGAAGSQAPRRTRRPLTLVLIASIWMATVGNVALWLHLPQLQELDNLRGLWFGLSFAVVIAAVMSAVLSLFAWRWTLKPAITVCLFATAFGTHFMLAYGVVIDTTMMVNVLQTNPRETLDLVSWQLLVVVLAMAVLPTIWLWNRPQQVKPLARQLLANATGFVVSIAVMAAVVVLQYQVGASVMRNHTQVRFMINPVNAFSGLVNIAAQPFKRSTLVTLPIGQDARSRERVAGAKPPLLVLVVGETARSGNFGINGYARQTTPELARENIASFRNAWSCGTSTAASLPCMFSHLGREAFGDRNANYENLLDLLQRAGLAVLWVDNQSGCKGLCDRVPNATTASGSDPVLCPSGECFDEVMLQGLDQRIAALPADQRAKGVVVVLHQMGSHGPAYYKRTPDSFKKFLPECTSNALQDCTQQELVNAFDNTVLYTDHFLAETIRWLHAHDSSAAPALMYVSDHGESLGENNLYLHGLPYNIAPDVQKHVPWIVWLSPAIAQGSGVDAPCLQQRRDVRLTHDSYFHSVLGLLGVETALYKPALDLFKPCTR